MNDRPHVILLHGAIGASAQLRPLGAALSSHFRVHLLDFEGHGESPERERPFRMAFFAEDVVDYMDANELERVSLFGYSMGGYVALVLAHDQRQRVDRIATLGTKYRWDSATAEREAKRLDPDVIRAKVPKFAEQLELRHRGAGGWEVVLSSTAELLRHLGDAPALTDSVLSSITQPTRVLIGDRDSTVNEEESRGAADTLLNGTLRVLSDTPHPIEQVDLAVLVPELVSFFSPSA